MIERREKYKNEAGFALYTLFTNSVGCLLSYALAREVLQFSNSPELVAITQTGIDLLLVAVVVTAAAAFHESKMANVYIDN